ncbi:unnamed protein product [Mytilus edulis]|uniref:DZIP3-like HEPN domain-containing protein n=1 Tax=Mytilus edulis TaxID=6550 RepID=A0A8S3USI8_MYTED|nr:unnamed protein product [Mytilus edulis]
MAHLLEEEEICVPDSTTFDVSLMICLIRNLKSISQPINGFDELPLPVETTPGADLARIKWFRNILAHPHKMAAVDFNTAWSNLSDAVSRLGGQPMNQECQELKVKILDQSNQEIMLEIKQSQEKIKELRQTVDILGTEHSEVTENLRKLQVSHSTLQTEHTEVTELLKDPIPWNIRGQIKEELETWTEDDKMFIETNGAKRESPIFIACYKGHVKVVELLLKHEADCNIKWRGLTPLDIARRENHTNIVHLLQKIEII